MSEIEVDLSLLRSLLDASSRTALSHRGDDRELYVLGQLEAAANMAYVLSAGKIDYEFEAYCQQLACYAIERMDAICAGVIEESTLSIAVSNQKA